MPTKISYLDETWNPVTGCSGKGCATRETCWARGMVKRFPGIHGYSVTDTSLAGYFGDPVPFSTCQIHPDRLDQPLRWRKPRRIGVCFMGDLFDEGVGYEWIEDIYGIMALCPQHQFFILTKQPSRMAEFALSRNHEICVAGAIGKPMDNLGPRTERRVLNKQIIRGWPWPLPNLWHGVSACTQSDLDLMMPDLLRTPGKKWLSLEPLLEPIKDFPLDHPKRTAFSQLDWVVVGCHSNPRKHPCKLEWIKSVVEQCQSVGVPVYVKQIEINGKCVRDPARFPEHLRVREYATDTE